MVYVGSRLTFEYWPGTCDLAELISFRSFWQILWNFLYPNSISIFTVIFIVLLIKILGLLFLSFCTYYILAIIFGEKLAVNNIALPLWVVLLLKMFLLWLALNTLTIIFLSVSVLPQVCWPYWKSKLMFSSYLGSLSYHFL